MMTIALFLFGKTTLVSIVPGDNHLSTIEKKLPNSLRRFNDFNEEAMSKKLKSKVERDKESKAPTVKAAKEGRDVTTSKGVGGGGGGGEPGVCF